ncbi:MAG: nicotianamine synthase family protein [Dyella sp.]|uniref:nicotianamine synthase family protein n=1 Tax=Dyella sp. TaxID=1869338 RepID=UPI003F7FEA26
MQSDFCEVESLEELGRGENASCETLESVLRCTSSFHVAIDKAAELLREDKSLIDHPRERFDLLDPLIVHIESRIFFANDTDELVFSLRHKRESVKLLNDAYCSWETALEQIFVRRLCGGDVVSLNDYRLNSRFQRLLKRESSMLNGCSPKRALFIGSGPFPISAIWLHRYLDIPVDGLDVSGDAVERSRGLIKTLGMGNSIRIIHETSPEYDVSEYDVIIIALLAKPKSAILENIYKSAKRDCYIVCRTSFGLRSVIYEPTLISPEILERFSIEDARIVSGSCDDTISSLLLKKIV